MQIKIKFSAQHQNQLTANKLTTTLLATLVTQIFTFSAGVIPLSPHPTYAYNVYKIFDYIFSFT